jgi:hypothetical protein
MHNKALANPAGAFDKLKIAKLWADSISNTHDMLFYAIFFCVSQQFL